MLCQFIILIIASCIAFLGFVRILELVTQIYSLNEDFAEPEGLLFSFATNLANNLKLTISEISLK
ncbi:hypothetical protein OA85_07200 [Flavobacterium sp. AED]|nr:hypothetical protein OA85_07200 [Flavobacterium sp. AED]